MLKCEDRKNGLSAISAFFKQKHIKRTRRREYDWAFEHGQLWILHIYGASWSVVDAEGGPAVNGFDFEQVSEGY